MAILKPFKGVRATRDKVALVSCKSLEIYTDEKLKAKLDFNPYTFLQVVHAVYKYTDKDSISQEQRFQLVRNRYLEFKENSFLKKDEEAAIYIYKKITPTNEYCGIIAATSVKDYNNNLIKKHEDTIEKRESLFERYLQKTNFNAEPVLLTYPDNDIVNTIISKHQKLRPEYEFSTTDKNTHLLWMITDKNDIEQIANTFKSIDSLYIADGHHRSASSALLARNKEKENSKHNGNEAYNFFMSYLIPESHLKISEFNRFVKDLNGLSKDEFLIKLDATYRIENRGQEHYHPSKKHHFSMYLDGEFYSLYLRKPVYEFTNALSKLDVEILNSTILKPILNIKDIRNDDRIYYSANVKDSLEIKNKVDSGEFKVSFGMLPITTEEIKQIADEGLKMPPKSTYIQPKLRSALTIYEF